METLKSKYKEYEAFIKYYLMFYLGMIGLFVYNVCTYIAAYYASESKIFECLIVKTFSWRQL
jgi:hypothetical protein